MLWTANLCRCGTHGRIVYAVLKAAGRAPGGQAMVPPPPAGPLPASQPPVEVPAGGFPDRRGPDARAAVRFTSPVFRRACRAVRRLPAPGRPGGQPGAGPVAGFQPGRGGDDPDRQGGVRLGSEVFQQVTVRSWLRLFSQGPSETAGTDLGGLLAAARFGGPGFGLRHGPTGPSSLRSPRAFLAA